MRSKIKIPSMKKHTPQQRKIIDDFNMDVSEISMASYEAIDKMLEKQVKH